jgi:large subunit ribosomal protein L5e
MPFVKVVKNKAYFKRFQVKFRRRREGRTDYRQRHKLITQDKNKYGLPKYRLVVRISNKFVYCQIVKAQMEGDFVICAANSKELEKHGLTVGLKNYSAAYCTGLLVARRLLNQLGLDEVYAGNDEVTGDVVSTELNGRTYFVPELDDEKKPFRALLDIGIKNTTTGANIFGALKGASDGGLDIPHSNKRFPGYSRDTKTFEADVHKGRIFGEHVAEYMREMEEDDDENYHKHFASYDALDIGADDLEELYEKVHASIREDPTRDEKEKFVADTSFKKPTKKTYAVRRADATAKRLGVRKALLGDDEAEDDEDAEEEEEDDE